MGHAALACGHPLASLIRHALLAQAMVFGKDTADAIGAGVKAYRDAAVAGMSGASTEAASAHSLLAYPAVVALAAELRGADATVLQARCRAMFPSGRAQPYIRFNGVSANE